MKFAIISAGEGSRLCQEGVSLPKPLVPLNGVPMIDRLVRLFIRSGAESVGVVINNENPLTREHLLALQKEVPLEVIVKTTPSSMHSFYELVPFLEGAPFCLTTVDTIFREEEFSAFIQTFRNAHENGLMAVTDFIDDEKPLYVSTGDSFDITGFYDTCPPACKYISGGIYCLPPAALRTLEKCVAGGMSRMRNFQRALIQEGFRLKAYPFSKIVDVDHVGDIAKAEAFLKDRKQEAGEK